MKYSFRFLLAVCSFAWLSLAFGARRVDDSSFSASFFSSFASEIESAADLDASSGILPLVTPGDAKYALAGDWEGGVLGKRACALSPSFSSPRF